MNADSWQQRWVEGKTAFHMDAVNPHLVRHLARLRCSAGDRILVPLCGKSWDMAWLAGQGFEVTGVELSPLAVEQFHREQKLEPKVTREGAFEVWRTPHLQVLCGDFFALDREHWGGFAGIWDRAALIALPASQRTEYVKHLQSVRDPGGRILLVTLAYDETRMSGPPYCVSEGEARAHYAGMEVEKLSSEDVIGTEPRLRERGLDRLYETVFLISERPAG